MGDVQLWRFIATLPTTMLLIPAVLIIIPWWRFSKKTMLIWACAFEILTAVFYLAVYACFGSSSVATWLTGVVPPLLCIWVFWYCCSLRDSRFPFLMVTIGLNTALCDAITSCFVIRGSCYWVLLRILLFLVQLVLLRLFCRDKLLEMLEGNQINWVQTSIIPLSLWVCCVAFYFPQVVIDGGRASFLPIILLTCASVMIYITLFRFQKATLEQADARQYKLLLHSEVTYLEREMQQAQEIEERSKILRHDLRHYARMLRGCLDVEDTASARDLVDMLEKNVVSLPVSGGLTSYTGRPCLDTVLTQTNERARRSDIRFDVRLELPSQLHVDEAELAIVLSNALENALIAAEKEPSRPQPFIEISCKPIGRQLLFECTNTFSGSLTIDEKTGLPGSTLPGHGYGTLSISNFVRKHQGTVTARVQDRRFILRMLV